MANGKEFEVVLPEEYLIRASGLLSLLMPDNSGIGVLVKGLDGRYQTANRTMAALIGKNPEDLNGKSDRDFFPPTVAKQLRRSGERIRSGAASACEEFDLSVNGQMTRWLSLMFPLLGPEGSMQSIGAFMIETSLQKDIVEMRQALEQLQRTNRELQIALAELDQLASTDKLTGAWNRRRLEEAVKGEMDRLRRYDHALCLLVLDIDLFKQVNDRYGHAAGDRLLVELAADIRSGLRTTDSLTRWGGEEFIILCPNTALSTAGILADRLRERIAGTKFSVPQSITVSIGVAECMPEEAWEQWFNRADAALLRAKALDRNQIQIAPEIPMRTGAAGKSSVNLVRLVWHSAYECGHASVDNEHMGLFRDANELLSKILSGCTAQETGPIAETLIRDALQHFQHEESIIANAGYPRAVEHAAIHRELVDHARALLQRYRGGNAGVGEIFQFLAHDVIAKHMLGADRDFFPYLGNQREAAER